VILSLAKNMLSCAIGLLLLMHPAWSQTFDDFRFVGIPGVPGGTVTSLTLGNIDGVGEGELSFFDAAGLSSVFTLTYKPSTVINSQTPVFSGAEITPENNPLPSLDDISFYTAELSHETNNIPASWFRLTHYQGIWSGVFRVANQIYSLDRERSENVIDVRSTPIANADSPLTLGARVSSVFDIGYFPDNATQRSLANALESIHVLDGLLSDSQGLTLSLEQIIIDNILQFTDTNTADNLASAIVDWRQRNPIEDNLATLLFVDQADGESLANSLSTNFAAILQDDATIILPHGAGYQFETSHSFGKLYNVREQSNTLQDRRETGLVSLPAVHWSEQQLEDFDANLPGRALRILSNDQSTNTDQQLPVPAELDEQLVDSDSQESATILQSDQTAQSLAPATSGGGSALWLCLAAMVFLRHRFRSARAS